MRIYDKTKIRHTVKPQRHTHNQSMPENIMLRDLDKSQSGDKNN